MIQIKTLEISGIYPAMHGMRNPKDSWHLEDTVRDADLDAGAMIGKNDHRLAMQLAHGGPVHAKYRRMITVYADIVAPLYWWKEYDTYKVGTVANSCSTMHRIHAKEFTLDDFSHEHLIGPGDKVAAQYNGMLTPMETLTETIKELNRSRDGYLYSREVGDAAAMKRFWWQMIQSLPSTYNQRRTVKLNYEVLAGICRSRRNHKLDEWHEFVLWAESLPYAELFLAKQEDIDG